MVKYDPKILQKYAEMLYRDASSVVLICSVTFSLIVFLVGFGIGSAVASSFVASENRRLGEWIIAIIGGVLGAVLGYAIGQAIAFWYRLKAQLTLCQKQIEYNTRVAAQLRQNTSFEEIVP
jgi:membrane protein YqaA with SNARE-associated domain